MYPRGPPWSRECSQRVARSVRTHPRSSHKRQAAGQEPRSKHHAELARVSCALVPARSTETADHHYPPPALGRSELVRPLKPRCHETQVATWVLTDRTVES